MICEKHEISNCDWCKPKPAKLKGTWNHGGVTVVEATYPGKCDGCGDYYDEGDRIGKRFREESGWSHEDCL